MFFRCCFFVAMALPICFFPTPALPSDKVNVGPKDLIAGVKSTKYFRFTAFWTEQVKNVAASTPVNENRSKIARHSTAISKALQLVTELPHSPVWTAGVQRQPQELMVVLAWSGSGQTREDLLLADLGRSVDVPFFPGSSKPVLFLNALEGNFGPVALLAVNLALTEAFLLKHSLPISDENLFAHYLHQMFLVLMTELPFEISEFDSDFFSREFDKSVYQYERISRLVRANQVFIENNPFGLTAPQLELARKYTKEIQGVLQEHKNRFEQNMNNHGGSVQLQHNSLRLPFRPSWYSLPITNEVKEVSESTMQTWEQSLRSYFSDVPGSPYDLTPRWSLRKKSYQTLFLTTAEWEVWLKSLGVSETQHQTMGEFGWFLRTNKKTREVTLVVVYFVDRLFLKGKDLRTNHDKLWISAFARATGVIKAFADVDYDETPYFFTSPKLQLKTQLEAAQAESGLLKHLLDTGTTSEAFANRILLSQKSATECARALVAAIN